MRALVTGGAGFIGSHIAEVLQTKARVRVLDNLRSGHKHNLQGLDVEFMHADVTDIQAVQRAVKGVDYVFHLAAMVSVPESMMDPLGCTQINTIGLLNVLRASADAGVKKLCLSSSAAIYGENPELPKREDMRPEPKSPYAVTKLDGEYYCEMFDREGWLDTVSLRYFNVFGPRQDPGSQYAAAIPIFLDRALKNQTMTIYGDGEQTRDFVYVKDVVLANLFFGMESGASGVFNIGYGTPLAIGTLAQQIISVIGSCSRVIHAPERPGDVKHSYASVAKARAVGFVPRYNFGQGLSETVGWWRDRLCAV